MPGTKVLVFGGTGPAGICLLRELLFRQHETIVFARTPGKIPEELTANPLLEVVQAELTNTAALSDAVSRSRVVLSLLGPNTIRGFSVDTYVSFYRSLFEVMRQHGVRRVFAMGTISIFVEGDQFSLSRLAVVGLVAAVANAAFATVRAVGRVFAEEAGDGVDWTVYRIAGIPGGSDEKSWREDREDGEAFEGYAGAPGWSMSQRRGALARWLVDAVEDENGMKAEWIGKMPAVSRLAGSGRRV